MPELPQQLLSRLEPDEAATLADVVRIVGQELDAVYATDADHHDASIGDNAQLFGLKIWHHSWFAFSERLHDVAGALVIDENNSHHIRVGPLKIAVHKLGDEAEDPISTSFPDGSPTQRAYGHRNGEQLTLFEDDPAAPVPDEQAYALCDLVVGHFGNPRQGLVKWYIGAYTLDAEGVARWAWTRRLEVEGVAADQAAATRRATTPFSEAEAPELEVRPRRQDATAEQDRAGELQ